MGNKDNSNNNDDRWAGKKLVFSSYPRVEGEAGWKIAKGLFGGCGNAGEGVGWTAGSGVDNHRDWE